MRFVQQRNLRSLRGLLTLLLVIGATAAFSQPPAREAVTTGDSVNVLTHHNDISRTGANLLETALTTSNVRAAVGGAVGFGKLFTRKVDGQMYAQPLYVSNLTINGVRRNVLYLATMHGSVYAFDADDPNATDPLWKVSILDPSKGIYPCPIWEVGGWDTNIFPEVGFVSTPVIDLSAMTIYCVGKTKEVAANGSVTYPNRLYAYNIITGAARAGSGIAIAATVPGTGDGANGDGTLSFDSARHQNRPGLLLLKGVLFMAFGSHSDITPYHGWVFAYDPKTLKQIAVWCSTPNGKTDPSGYPLGAGGIWMSGQGLTADSLGNIFLEIGNGTFSADVGGSDYGDSFVKLRFQNNKISVADYFTPYNQDWLNRVDADLGVSGPMLIPGTNLMVGGGKEGRLYLVDKNKMGGFNPNGDTQIPQWFWSYNGHLHGSPVYWDSPIGPMVYLWGEYSQMKGYLMNRTTQRFNATPKAVSAMYVPNGMPGAILSLSANRNKSGTGIVWATHPFDDDAIHKVVTGIVRAFDAVTLKEIWNTKMVPERDDIGLFAKFTPPTIANGKLYMASFSNEVSVYGISKWVETPAISPASGSYPKANGPVTVTISDTVAQAALYYTIDGSDPTPNSTRYTAPFALTNSAIVKVRGYATGFQPSGVAVAKYLIDNGPGNGDGLTGNYFNNLYFGDPSVTRIDPVVDFPNWGGQYPVPGVGPDNWTARWTGKVLARTSGPYTFTTNSDDGVRLWVNGQLVIDNWSYHGPTLDSGTITLTAGQKYDIKMEYFEGGGGAVAQLFWASDFWDRQLIPQSQLFSQ